VIAWRGRAAAAGSYEFWLTLSILLSLTTITLLPASSVCDHIILLPGIFLLTRRNESHNPPGYFERSSQLVSPFCFWPWLAAVGLSCCVLFFVRSVLFQSTICLTLRTAASFPFAVLALLSSRLRMRQKIQADPLSFPNYLKLSRLMPSSCPADIESQSAPAPNRLREFSGVCLEHTQMPFDSIGIPANDGTAESARSSQGA